MADSNKKTPRFEDGDEIVYGDFSWYMKFLMKEIEFFEAILSDPQGYGIYKLPEIIQLRIERNRIIDKLHDLCISDEGYD